MSPRAEGPERPQNYSQCMVCGSAWEIANGDAGPGFKAFLAEHADCKMLGIAAARCREPECRNTGIGITQRCVPHGGKPVPRSKPRG